MSENTGLTYRDAGVDIDAGNALVERIKPSVARTSRPGVLGAIGGFGGLFELPAGQYERPVLVAATDGVGTKLSAAVTTGRHGGVGVDLVAMCVNDLVVAGAEPLFFLDYYASGHLDVDVAASVIDGIARGCELAGCALIGGETAELPGMYSGGDYDLAGFSVGVVEHDRIIDGARVAAGDRIIGLASSGLHSNGYSLVRKVIEHAGADEDTRIDGTPLYDIVMEPTRIYVKSCLALMDAVDVHAMAHITGGGLPENLPRVLPTGLGARVVSKAWKRPAIFNWLQQEGRIAQAEMYRTFNCGIGMTVVVSADDADRALALLEQAGETAAVIGEIVPDADGSVLIDRSDAGAEPS